MSAFGGEGFSRGGVLLQSPHRVKCIHTSTAGVGKQKLLGGRSETVVGNVF